MRCLCAHHHDAPCGLCACTTALRSTWPRVLLQSAYGALMLKIVPDEEWP